MFNHYKKIISSVPMIEFSDLRKELNQLQAFFNELESLNRSSQTETEEYIEYARDQLHILIFQIQEIKSQLEATENENKLLQSKLEEALTVRDQLAIIGPCYGGIPENHNNETNELIKMTEELKEEVKVLQKELIRREKYCQDIQNSHRRAEDVIINENSKLKDKNESLNVELKSLNQSYNNVKKDFFTNVETLKLLKLKLIEQKQCIQENEQLRIDNTALAEELKQVLEKYEKIKNESESYVNELSSVKEKLLLDKNLHCEENEQIKNENTSLTKKLQQVQEKYEKIKDESKLYLNELNLMKEKIMEKNTEFEINKALKEENNFLRSELENSKACINKHQQDLKDTEKLLHDATEMIDLREAELCELKNNLVKQQKLLTEIKDHDKKDIKFLQLQCNEYIKREKVVRDKLCEYSNIYREQMEVLNDTQNYLIYCNIHYEIDVDYLKSVILNQTNYITNLEELVKKLDKPKAVLKDVEVLAIESVVTKDVGVLAVDKNEDEKEKIMLTTNLLNKVLDRIDTYKERNQNPCDSKDVSKLCTEEDAYISKVLGMIDQKISSLLGEVKDFYETSICDLHKKYKSEAERQLSFSETSLAKLKFCYEKNLKYMKREHDEKVIRLLASHEEEIKNVSLYQQKIHSIKEKINKGKRSKKN